MTSIIASMPGQSFSASASFTRPADTTAYASGDLVANSTTAVSVVALALVAARNEGASGIITRLRLAKSTVSLTNASFRVHLYKANPTEANGDNGAWSTTGANGDYIGSFDVTMDKAFTDGAMGAGVPGTGNYSQFVAANQSKVIYALIEARAAYSPGNAEVFTLYIEGFQD